MNSMEQNGSPSLLKYSGRLMICNQPAMQPIKTDVPSGSPGSVTSESDGPSMFALRFDISGRQADADLIHHTDRGGQYVGAKYRRVLERARMFQSMSRADDCYDNAFMESCFGTIKRELEMERYEDKAVASKEIFGYIRYYNARRRHSSLGYLTPTEFEAIKQAPCEPQSVPGQRTS